MEQADEKHDIEEIVEESQDFEEEIFLSKIREFYEEEFEKSAKLFDHIAEETDNFRRIGQEIIREEPNVVKIFRYLVQPPISQMKFGQFADVNSTNSYEEEDPTTPQKKTAERMATFVEENIDKRKVPWLYEDVDEQAALERSRRWTCDIIAQSEAKTRYRNWRKDIQEEKVANMLDQAGLDYVDFSTTFDSQSTLPNGAFTRETKVDVTGSSRQKADFIIKTESGDTIFMEAKAIGVKLDSYKRIKEIRNKAADWQKTYPESHVCATLSGWIPVGQIESLLEDDIDVFWEHQLDQLKYAMTERF